MKLLILIALCLLSQNLFAKIYLTCRVSGVDQWPMLEDKRINEVITVTIIEDIFLSIEIDGSQLVSTVVLGKKTGKRVITNHSDSIKWDLYNSEKSEKDKSEISDHVIINRKTGIIHVNRSYGLGRSYFTGLCEKSVKNKF